MARTNGAPVNEELASLTRIEELLTVIAKTLLWSRLEEILNDPKHRMIYEGAGRVPIKELAKKTRTSFTTISGLWQKWEQAGLLVKEGKQYRRVI